MGPGSKLFFAVVHEERPVVPNSYGRTVREPVLLGGLLGHSCCCYLLSKMEEDN